MPSPRTKFNGRHLPQATICLQEGRPDLAAAWIVHDLNMQSITETVDQTSLVAESDGSISYTTIPTVAEVPAFRRITTATAIYHPHFRKVVLGFNPNPGRGWELPGGKQDRDESVEQCARREVLEECGLNVDPVFVGYLDDEPAYCCMFFVAVSDDIPRVMEPLNHSQWTWWNWQELPSGLNPITEKLRQRFPWPAVALKLGILQ